MAGRIKPGDKMLPVRDFASKFKVNPNTAQRALKSLEDEGFLFTERTNGKYITEDIEFIELAREKYAKELTKEYIKKMREIGLMKGER